MADNILTFTMEGSVAHIRLTNPARGNVLDMAMIKELATVSESLAKGQARSVLISAEGKNFCVGGDIQAFASTDDRGGLLNAMAGRLHEGLKAINISGLPVVVAVNGAAAGAGLSLASSGDIVLGGKGSSYMLAYTALGFTADGGATYFLPRLIGMRRTQEMFYTNRRLSADEAQDWGLITRVVDDEALLDEAMAVAQSLASGPTYAFRRIKAMLEQTLGNTLDAQLNLETDAISASAASPDGGAGVQAFLTRGKAEFTGKA